MFRGFSQLADACIVSHSNYTGYQLLWRARLRVALLIFWHKIRIDCARAHSGLVANIMRRTRLWHHAAIRACPSYRNEEDTVNERFASSIINNNNRGFWHEAAYLRCRRVNVVTSWVVSETMQTLLRIFDKHSTFFVLYNIVSCEISQMTRFRAI